MKNTSLPSLALSLLAAFAVGALTARPAQAQPADRYLLDQFFPTGVPGYGVETGTTVLSRARPDYDPLGIRAGNFVIRPEVDESLGYNDNVLGSRPAKGSFLEETDASLRFNSDFTRNSIGGQITVDDRRTPNVANQDRTDFTVSLGGTLDIGRDALTVAASHLSLHQDPTALDTAGFRVPGTLETTPIPFTIDDVRASYTADFGRIKLVPDVDFTRLQFSNLHLFSLNGTPVPAAVGGLVAGIPTTQNFRDRDLYEAGLTTRYEFAPQRDALLVVRDTATNYTAATAGLFGANRSSNGVQVLAGLDYQSSAVFRYRVLVGYEVREFHSGVYKQHAAPIAEANVIWQPTGLTTVTFKALHTIEDAADENVAGFDYTATSLRVDHELLRNVLLSAHVGLEYASYLQSRGTETFYDGGVGATWLINRNIHATLSYDLIDHNGANGFGPNYLQNIGLLELQFAL